MWRQIPIVDEECTAKALKACGGWAYDLCVHDAHLVAMGCGFPTAVNSEGQFMHEQPLHLTTSYRFGGNDAPKVTTICGATDGVEGFMHEFDAKFESGQTAVFRGNKLCVGGEDVTGTLPSGDTIDVFARQVEAFDAHCRDEGPIGAADPKLAAQTLRILEAQIQSAESASWKDVTVQ